MQVETVQGPRSRPLGTRGVSKLQAGSAPTPEQCVGRNTERRCQSAAQNTSRSNPFDSALQERIAGEAFWKVPAFLALPAFAGLAFLRAIEP